jgi:hypothetical protein
MDMYSSGAILRLLIEKVMITAERKKNEPLRTHATLLDRGIINSTRE